MINFDKMHYSSSDVLNHSSSGLIGKEEDEAIIFNR